MLAVAVEQVAVTPSDTVVLVVAAGTTLPLASMVLVAAGLLLDLDQVALAVMAVVVKAARLLADKAMLLLVPCRALAVAVAVLLVAVAVQKAVKLAVTASLNSLTQSRNQDES